MQSSPYFIDGEIRIHYGKRLVIEPGVHVVFTGHYKLIVNGILKAKGTESDSIYFIPSDTAVGWHGISFIEAEDRSNLDYCVLKDGKTAIAHLTDDNFYKDCGSDPDCDTLDFSGGAILVYKSNPIISHCAISDNVLGIDAHHHHHHHAAGEERTKTKARIRALKKKRDEILASADHAGLKAVLNEIRG